MTSDTLTRFILPILLALIALLHLLPLAGLFGTEGLQRLYGIEFRQPDLLLLMRHRALLFGLIGGIVLIAIWRPELRMPALLISGLSMAGFIVLARIHPPLQPELHAVVRADLIGLLIWAVALILQRRSGASAAMP